jgi:tRNA threonylcarbamoyl adenosine modification protein YeaZ
VSGWLLAIDTATRQATLALGDGEGMLVAGREWPAGHAHSETLLPALRALLATAGIGPAALTGVVVGTGPGGFTGLRVGLAMAKTLAHGLRVPIVGMATSEALAAAAMGPGSGGAAAVVQPAGPSDRYLTRVIVEAAGDATADGAPSLLAPADFGPTIEAAAAAGEHLVAVDLDDAELPDTARELGRRALAGLGAALLAAGARALAAGRAGDVAALVPIYVTLPRGVAATSGAPTWSPDLR